MDLLSEFLELMIERKLVAGRLRALFHVVIGRTVHDSQGRLICGGTTWRTLANTLKDLRYDTELVRELGLDPETLSPRDRKRFWYSAIAGSKPDSAQARLEAVSYIFELQKLGFRIGAAPIASPPTLSSPPAVVPNDDEEKPKPGRRKFGGKQK